MRVDRIRNLGLNAALLVFGAVVVVLAWSLVGGSIAGDGGSPESGLGGDIVQLDVRNGCGESGLAATMADYLRGEGFDVVEEGDWTRFDVGRTVVLDRIGDDRPARAVMDLLGLDDERLRDDIRPDYYLDATLVIGCDYETLPPFREQD